MWIEGVEGYYGPWYDYDMMSMHLDIHRCRIDPTYSQDLYTLFKEYADIYVFCEDPLMHFWFKCLCDAEDYVTEEKMLEHFTLDEIHERWLEFMEELQALLYKMEHY